MKIDIKEMYDVFKYRSDKSTKDRTCMFSGLIVPKNTTHLTLAKTAFGNKLNYSAVHPEALVFFLFCLTGDKYLKKKYVKEIKDQWTAELI